MSEKEFLEKLTEVADTESLLTLDTELASIDEWDSLSLVSFLAMAEASYGKKISRDQVRKAITVSDLFQLVK